MLNVSEPAVKYTVTLEPNGEHWLLALDVPTQIIPDSVMTRDFQLISKGKVNDLQRYSMESRLAYTFGLDESLEYLDLARHYPPDFNPKTIALGKSLAAKFDSSDEIIDHALNMFSQDDFYYTLKPPVLGRDTVDEFLFDSRRGFCEHYAGSFALLMRAAGIPVRQFVLYRLQGGNGFAVKNSFIGKFDRFFQTGSLKS